MFGPLPDRCSDIVLLVNRSPFFGDDLHVRAADGHGVNPYQNLGGSRFRNGLFRKPELFRIVEDPSLHRLGTGSVVSLSVHSSWSSFRRF